MAATTDVVVVGGGVVGLSIAYVLAGEGASVALIDAGPLGRAASWAGAGMISPVPRNVVGSDPWVGLRARSLELQSAWSESLRAETGIDNGYRRCGGLDIALTESEAAEQERRRPFWEAEGVRFERIEAPAIRRLEPTLRADLRQAYHFPDRAQIRNPRHLRALIEAARLRGVALHENRGASGFDVRHGRVDAVETPLGPLPCGSVVVAAGPWTSELLKPLSLDAPTPPLRGQIVLLRWPEVRLRRIVEQGANYLVPRDDGRVLVGSTEEWAGFDPRPTADGVLGLLDLALKVCPELAASDFERAWAGLRPASKDGRPYLGRAPEIENLFLAAGHRRVGLQLSPGTAELMADLVLGRTPRWDPAAFAVDRHPVERDESAFQS